MREIEAGPPLTEAERNTGFRCYDTEDLAISYRAFRDKKKPDFVER